MSSGLANVRTAIFNTLSGVSGIAAGAAQVHRYFRIARTDGEVKALLTVPGHLHVWMIALAGSDPYITVNSAGTPGRDPANTEHATYTFNLHGYYSVKDSVNSEETFVGIVEAVIAAFRADKKLQGTVIDSGPIQWVQGGGPPDGHVMFPRGEGGVLCHYARLSLSAHEQVEP